MKNQKVKTDVKRDASKNLISTKQNNNDASDYYDNLFKTTQEQMESQNVNIIWNITPEKFYKKNKNCFVCGKNLQIHGEIKRSIACIIDDKNNEINENNLGFSCNVCYRIKELMGSFDMIQKKSSNIYSHYANDVMGNNSIIHNDVTCNNVCKYKYNDIK